MGVAISYTKRVDEMIMALCAEIVPTREGAGLRQSQSKLEPKPILNPKQVQKLSKTKNSFPEKCISPWLSLISPDAGTPDQS